MNTVPAAEPANPLRPDRCPDCGYLLTGLPEKGQCPECGQRYDSAETIVLFGRTRSASTAGTIIAGTAGCVGCFGLWLLTSFVLWHVLVMLRLHPSIAGVLAACVPLVLLFRYLSRLTSTRWPAPDTQPADPSALMQLRLSSEGFGLRSGFGLCRLQPWPRGMRVQLSPDTGGYYLLEIVGPPVELLLPKYRWRLRFVFECSETLAEQVRRRVERWIGPGSRPSCAHDGSPGGQQEKRPG